MTEFSESGDGRRSFFAELKRRHVFRVLGTYAVVAYVVIQAASLTFGPLHLPPSAMTLVVVLAILGFPVAAVLAWAFETTPEGVRPTPGGSGGSWVHAAALLVGAVALTVAAGFGVRAWLGASALPFLGGGHVAGPAVQAPAAGSASAATSESGSSSVIRLAVLPLENRSPDAKNAYFAGGMTDELNAALSGVPGFVVIGQRSAARFANASITVPQIADSLGVRYVLEGSASLADGKGTIRAQLVDGRGDSTVWTRRFQRPARDVEDLEVDVARKAVASLRSSLTEKELAAIEARSTQDPVAFDLYLRAERLPTTDAADVQKSIGLLRRAVARDSTFAWAWMQLGVGYGLMGLVSPAWADSSRAAFTRGARFARTAEVRGMARTARAYFTGSLDSAIAIGRRSLAADPDEPILLYEVTLAEANRGHLAAAFRWAKRSRDLDPLNASTWTMLGLAYEGVGLFADAERAWRKAIALDSAATLPWAELREERRLEGRCRAAQALEDTLVAVGGDPQELENRGVLYLCAGNARQARTLLDSAYRARPWRDVVQFAPELVRARELTGDTVGLPALVRRAEASLAPHPGLSTVSQEPVELAAVLGHGARAAGLLRAFMKRGGGNLIALLDDPEFGAVRKDTAFGDALAQAKAFIADQRREVRQMLARDGG